MRRRSASRGHRSSSTPPNCSLISHETERPRSTDFVASFPKALEFSRSPVGTRRVSRGHVWGQTPTMSAAATVLAEAVRAREAVGEVADEERGREADDVQVVAFDPLDECG